MPQELSFEEVARMRQIVAQFDADRKPMSTVDLNNPPREQYRFQKFPMMVYDLTRSTPAKVFHKTADSEEELQDLIEAGWSVQAPEFTEEREEPLSPQYQAEAARVDDQIETLRQKRAYNRKPVAA